MKEEAKLFKTPSCRRVFLFPGNELRQRAGLRHFGLNQGISLKAVEEYWNQPVNYGGPLSSLGLDGAMGRLQSGAKPGECPGG